MRYENLKNHEHHVCNLPSFAEKLKFAWKMKIFQNQEHPFILNSSKNKRMFFQMQNFSLFGIFNIFREELSEFCQLFSCFEDCLAFSITFIG